ncbi:type VI secretion system Vgr family protein, partial [Chromobacterium piscinae]|uniref:type VI secretion system Vgr family protein n=1 Tax=Chromobacterium piscinae TaxID=686831 RepID=UPI003261D180
ITGVLYNGSHPTPDFSGAGSLPANKTLSGIKSKEHQGGGYNELLFDDTPGEVRAKLSSEPGKTQLNQGYLAHPRSNGKAQPRGDGFELRTDHHGAIRAAHGLLLTTEAQNGASGKQLAREHAQSQLDAALSLSQALAETATGQLADTMETGPDEIGPDNAKAGKKTDGHLQHHADALKAWEVGSNTDKDGKTAKEQAGRQPLLVLSGPAGIASLTEQSQTISAGQNLNLVAQRDANHTHVQHHPAYPAHTRQRTQRQQAKPPPRHGGCVGGTEPAHHQAAKPAHPPQPHRPAPIGGKAG